MGRWAKFVGTVYVKHSFFVVVAVVVGLFFVVVVVVVVFFYVNVSQNRLEPNPSASSRLVL